jgi:hypothetical protein
LRRKVDKWMGGWNDGRMAGGRGWIDEWMDECVNERMDGGWMDGSLDVGRGCMDKWKGWLDGLMGGSGDIIYESYWISVITLKKKVTIKNSA